MSLTIRVTCPTCGVVILASQSTLHQVISHSGADQIIGRGVA